MRSRREQVWRPIVKATRLAGWRLSRSLAWKAAVVMAALASVGFTLAVVILGAHGRTDGVHAVLARTCVTVAWLAGPLVALWAAADRAHEDKADGLEQLALMHGVDAVAMAWGRAIAATLRTALLVLATTAPVLVAVTACAPAWGPGLRSAAAIVPLVGFAAGVGIACGGLAAACGRMAPRRGRTLWMGIVLLPWMLDGVLTGARAGVSSVPGLLGMLANLAGDVGTWS